MKIFNDEKSIAHLFQNKSIACSAPIDISTEDELRKRGAWGNNRDSCDLERIVSASIKDKELYYHKSILVTTSWNKNDDVFTPAATWAARNTPVHKPTNLEHQSHKIIGHMTGSWAISPDGNLIDDTTEASSLPAKFHILVGSVIYKFWPDNEEYAVQVASLLDAIEKGQKYVSMECRFEDFDYALSDGSDLKLIARNENTAFLSKHLRSYGGDGVFNNYKVGRAVKGISFIGKGYVDKPANPESIIFSKEDVFDFANAKFSEKIDNFKKVGVTIIKSENYSHNEEQIMSEFYQDLNKKLEAQVELLNKERDELKEKFAQSHITKVEADLASARTELDDMSKALKAGQEELEKKSSEASDLVKKIADLTAANDELTKQNKELIDKVSTIEAAQKIQARVASLLEAGVSKEDAEKHVSTFAAFDDEQFKVVSELLIQTAKFMKKDEKKEMEKPEAKAESLEEVEVTSPEVTSASEEADIDDDAVAFASLVEHLSAELKVDIKNGDK